MSDILFFSNPASREYFCDVCGLPITARQGWHNNSEGMKHWTCEMMENRRKDQFHTDKLPVRKQLWSKGKQPQPVGKLVSAVEK